MKKFISITVIFLFLFQVMPVYAHKLLIEPSNPGEIKVIYEDGSFSSRTIVYVYDKEGNEIDQGHLDSEGYFHYDSEEAYSFIADDGMGHRSEWAIGEEVVVLSDSHRWIVIGVVVFVFISIAAFFTYRTKKKTKGNV